jgi:hypothetical protein
MRTAYTQNFHIALQREPFEITEYPKGGTYLTQHGEHVPDDLRVLASKKMPSLSRRAEPCYVPRETLDVSNENADARMRHRTLLQHRIVTVVPLWYVKTA